MLPEYFKPQLDNKERPYKSMFFRIKRFTITCIITVVTTALITVGLFYLFKCVSKTQDPDYISIGASIVTFFSAAIAVICLLDNIVIRQFASNVNILESKYTGKISGWNFLRRYSYNMGAGSVNHKLSSAYYKLYISDEPKECISVVVPVLYADFFDTKCLNYLRNLKRIIPKYKKYIFDKQSTEDMSNKEEKQQHLYYLILPDILRSLFKGILYIRILRFSIILCNLLILSTIAMTIIFSVCVI